MEIRCKCTTGALDPLIDVLSHELDEGRERRQAKDWAADAAASAAAAAADAEKAADAAQQVGDGVQLAAESAAAAERDAALAAQSTAAAATSADRAQQAQANAAGDRALAQTAAGEASAAAEAAAAGRAGADTAAAAARQDAQAARTGAAAAAASAADAAGSKQDAAASAAAAAADRAAADTAAAAAADSETAAGRFAQTAKSYAVGGTGTREEEQTDNAAYYYQQAKRISQGLQGALLPMGSIPFAELKAVQKSAGCMYDVTDAFVTDATFKEGAGRACAAGTNVYWTVDGFWDVLPGTQVTGVKGEAESLYRLGQVNITKADLGLDRVENTPDSAKAVASAGRVAHALTFAGAAAGRFDGSADLAVSIPAATRVKGEAEQEYRTGDVSLAPADIGAMSTAETLAALDEAIAALPKALPNPNALTFGGAVSASYDGSSSVSVSIPSVPTALPNPNKLSFSGASSASYDGSNPVTVNIPKGGIGTLHKIGAYTGSIGTTNARTTIALSSSIAAGDLLLITWTFVGSNKAQRHKQVLKIMTADEMNGGESDVQTLVGPSSDFYYTNVYMEVLSSTSVQFYQGKKTYDSKDLKIYKIY